MTNNIEFVYKLNLPNLETVTNTNFFKTLELDKNKIFRYDSTKITDEIKDCYKTICEFNFQTILIFYKKDIKGRIHSDSFDSNVDMWGINWIHGGTCFLEYWDESINDKGTYTLDSQKRLIKKWDENNIDPPIKTYIMPPGSYLVNATAIHRPSAVGSRHAISIRTALNKTIKWNQVVNKFQDLIQGVPETTTDLLNYTKFLE